MNRVIKFWKDSYTSDPVSFYLELISFIFVVTATMLIAISAKNPNMALIYPFFLVSSIAAAIAHIKRGLAWPLVASCYFVCVNIVGLIRAVA